MEEKKVSGAVTWGLLAAWAANDLEEIATMAGWLRTARPELRKRMPWVPERVWRRTALSQREVNTAIGLMGGIVAAAAADGARTGGRSPFFGTVLAGFGLHGVVHLAQSAAYGGYTPGVVTSPTVVIPYSLWALRRLREAGVPVGGGRTVATGLAFLPVAVVGVHTAARLLCRRREAGI
ncbi:HXXEE domain-containing protein [Streptomyces sp. NBC_00385]|uniref:HXXEE domain-containing protein n=1 Tax=Streptomyces sp. NBC_00385 TaxID=2975733 RepID=UPI002DDBA220|nr:HXXEE domain-containing protein [Streptomyces sp. NBC_00385]WRZ07249.1 HXXEE domain-containing protein [Streptomyces sp. NBC_00385]